MFSSEDDELYKENFKLINESIVEVSNSVMSIMEGNGGLIIV